MLDGGEGSWSTDRPRRERDFSLGGLVELVYTSRSRMDCSARGDSGAHPIAVETENIDAQR